MEGLGELPPGWAWARLGDLVQRIESGKNVRAIGRPPRANEVGIVKVSAVTWGEFDESQSKALPPNTDYNEDNLIQPGDFLISRANTLELVGAPVIVKTCSSRLVLSDKILRVRFLGDVSRWVELFLKSILGRQQIEAYSQGAQLSMRNISQDNLRRIAIPLAPQRETEFVLASCNSALTDLDEAEAALARARTGLADYRASLLHAACTGQLTAAWRASQPAPTEDGAALLRRILAERRAAWEREECIRRTARGQVSLVEAWKTRYQEPEGIEPSEFPGLPSDWIRVSIRQSGLVQLGRQRAPQYHSGPNMHPYLRVANVYENRIKATDVMEMVFDGADFTIYKLEKDDILLNEGQSADLVGRPAIFNGEIENCCFTNTIIRYRPVKAVLPKYALLVFRLWLRNGVFQSIAKVTTNIAHLGTLRFEALPFAVPSISEQKRILEMTDDLLADGDISEAGIAAAISQLATLRQSTLHAAFTGRLVPQDPADEPASALLARLRAAPAPSRARRPRTQAAP